jgi:hypothetical protein
VKVDKRKNNIERHGVGTESAFTIKASSQAFEILSSGLYADKVLAVVRELSCNAYDAHVEAGKKDEPFEIHLPNRLEPFFAVTDNGVGLSHDNIMGLYTTYFDSTKDESNDFIGAFGLGSKSPFSYANNFEVVSRHEGMKRIYQIFINEAGIPAVALFGETHTDECNGLQVKLTVKSQDNTKFRDRVRACLKYFPVKPKVVGDPYFKFETLPKSAVEGDGWIAYETTNSYYYNHDLVAIQGNVPYKVDSNQFNTLNQHQLSFLRGTRLAIQFDIGELDIAASREEIQYTPKSIASLEQKAREIINTIGQMLDKRAWKFNRLGYWSASIEYRRLAKTLFGRSVWDYVKPEDVKCPTLKKYLRNKGTIDVKDKLKLHTLVLYKTAWRAGSYSRHKMNHTITPDAKMAVMINDLRIGGIKRTKKWLNSQDKYSTALMVNRRKDISPKPTDAEFEKETDKIEKLLGKPTILVVSEDTDALTKTKRPKFIFKFFAGSKSTRKRSWWERLEVTTDVDVTKGGYYIDLYKGVQVRDENGEDVDWAHGNLKTYLPQMLKLLNDHRKDIGLKKQTDIYASPSLSAKDILKNGGWHNAFELTKKLVKKHKTSVDHIRRMEQTLGFMSLKEVVCKKWFCDALDDLNDDSIFRTTVDEMRKEVATNKPTEYEALIKSFIKPPKTILPYFNPNDITAAYPMLSFVPDPGYYGTLKGKWRSYLDYVQIIDNEEI